MREPIKQGVYRHYKGGFYLVLCTARDSENGPNEGRELVVYASLSYGHVCVRPREQFDQLVDPHTLRFAYVGTTLKAAEVT